MDIGDLLSMAGNASGTLSNLVSGFDRFKKLADEGELPPASAEQVLALSMQLGQAQLDLAHLETEIIKLKSAYDALDEIKQRKRNYVLVELPMGGFVYRLKEDAGTGEPSHDVCSTCFEQPRICILQPRNLYLECDSCNAKLRIKKPPRTQSNSPPRV